MEVVMIVCFVCAEGQDVNIDKISYQIRSMHKNDDELVFLPYGSKSVGDIVVDGVTIGTEAIILDHGGNIERLGFPTDQLPEYLCNGDKEERKAREKKEKLEKPPEPCEKCFFLSTEFTCPSCGHVPLIPPTVETTDEALKKIERGTHTASEKNDWYGQLLGYARKHGYKDGWASHKYKEKFGVWPAMKTGISAVEPSKEVRDFITHMNIKAKKKPRYVSEGNTSVMRDLLKKNTEEAQKKMDEIMQDAEKNSEGFHAEPQPGYDYSLKVAENGTKMVRVEKDGVFQGWAKQTDAIMDLVPEL